MQDKHQAPIVVEDRRVARLPVLGDEQPARIAHVVALHRHGVRLAGFRNGFQRVEQPADAVGRGIVGIVGKHVEQLLAGHLRPLGQGGRGVGVVDVDDMQARARLEQQQGVVARLELALECADALGRGARQVLFPDQLGVREGPACAGLQQRQRALRGDEQPLKKLDQARVGLDRELLLVVREVLLLDESLHDAWPCEPSRKPETKDLSNKFVTRTLREIRTPESLSRQRSCSKLYQLRVVAQYGEGPWPAGAPRHQALISLLERGLTGGERRPAA